MFIIGFLLSGIAFLLPFRSFPDGDFYADVFSIALALLAITFCFRRFVLSREVLLLLCLAGLMLVSGYFAHGYYYDVWVLPALVLMIYAGFLSGVVGLVRNERFCFLYGCFTGLIFGGVASLIIAFFQVFGVVDYLGELAFSGTHGVYANIAQRNAFSTYMLLFVCGLSFFATINRAGRWLAVCLLPFVAFVLAYSASRMVLLDALLVALLCAGLNCWVELSARNRRFIGFILFFLIILAVFQLLLLASYGGGASRITLQGDTPRLGEWLKAWRIFTDHPLGIGFGNYAKFSFIYQVDSGEVGSQITWSNAHNIIVQFVVEFGIWCLPLLVYFLWCLLNVFRRCIAFGASGLAVFCSLLFLLVHSLLEYPLWYMNFLLLFVALLGVFGADVRVGARRRVINLIRVTATGCVLVLSLIVVDYSRMPAYRIADNDMRVNIQRLTDLLKISLNPALAWPADKVLNEYLIPDAGPELNFTLCKSINMAVREPLYPYLERVALLAIAGQDFDFASSVLKSRYAVYPDQPDTYLKARIRFQWPSVADEYVQKIDSERRLGFPGADYYRLTIPRHCLIREAAI